MGFKVIMTIVVLFYRPHPVKPLNSESQQPTSSPAVKEIKIWDTTPGKTKVSQFSQIIDLISKLKL